ncbi:hypothetical protein J0895_21605 [Phormidium pseudopriestleyi FRX01]|uniref:Peptidase A2 domain-containing protein n=1 Tax=Phormidium pseudopriestleyi FRX01 TaxID=1759528 RepID=A0ABS3FWZ4_9CYAN|nr:hypothetical protein [Phormidium pseudopriestleyi]MBO0351631.1 hypothetical protein [Phormidium pseudopriestleyi FRX01]
MKNKEYRLECVPCKNLLNPQERVNLFLVRAGIGAKGTLPVFVPLLVDSGATYTTLPVPLLQSVGCDLKHPITQVSIVTGNGQINCPVVTVPWFNCLGHTKKKFPRSGTYLKKVNRLAGYSWNGFPRSIPGCHFFR